LVRCSGLLHVLQLHLLLLSDPGKELTDSLLERVLVTAFAGSDSVDNLAVLAETLSLLLQILVVHLVDDLVQFLGHFSRRGTRLVHRFHLARNGGSEHVPKVVPAARLQFGARLVLLVGRDIL
ncbi:hypothetical protein PMAYCL1PPCAC_26847, partial [Pristionchus mayeri]